MDFWFFCPAYQGENFGFWMLVFIGKLFFFVFFLWIWFFLWMFLLINFLIQSCDASKKNTRAVLPFFRDEVFTEKMVV